MSPKTEKQTGFTWKLLEPLIQMCTPKGVYLFRIFLKCFLKPIYPNKVAKKFQMYGVKITERCICESKNWICSFLLIPPSKTLSHAEGNYPFHPHKIFGDFFSRRNGGGLWSWKNDQIKLARVLVTSWDKFPHLFQTLSF